MSIISSYNKRLKLAGKSTFLCLFLYYFRYILYLLGIQSIFRIIFLLAYHKAARGIVFTDQLLALVHGLKLDFSLTGYCLLFPTIILIAFSLFRKPFILHVIGVYNMIILIPLLLVYLTNLVLYKFWKYPADISVLDFISTPGEMMASVPLAWLLAALTGIILLVYLLHFRIYKKWVAIPARKVQKLSWPGALFFLICLPLLFLPIRGGMGTAPMNTGAVYFHKETFINHTAVNPVWNLLYTMTETKKLGITFEYTTDEKAESIVKELYSIEADPLSVLKTRKPNIIIVLMESFTPITIQELGGNAKEVAPVFHALIPEGIYFDNFFASGNMTDRALGAVMGGYISPPGTSILYFEKKAEKLPGLCRDLGSAGYTSSFLYGGDIDFAHIRSYLHSTGFDRIISDRDFPSSVLRTNWGIPDHIMFPELIEESNRASTPFFNVLLTLSNHIPWDVPMEPVYKGNSVKIKMFNSTYYADRELGRFIDSARRSSWWDETLIILLADHGARAGNMNIHEEQSYRIPMLWTGGALSIKDTIIHNYCSQTDLPLSILNQLNIPKGEYLFSNDLLTHSPNSFAFYSFHEGLGMISEDSYQVYSMTSGEFLVNPTGPPGDQDKILGFLQYLVKDFNQR